MNINLSYNLNIVLTFLFNEKSLPLIAILFTLDRLNKTFKSRLAEHNLAIKNQEQEKSALCEHSIQFDHLIDWNNS